MTKINEELSSGARLIKPLDVIPCMEQNVSNRKKRSIMVRKCSQKYDLKKKKTDILCHI